MLRLLLQSYQRPSSTDDKNPLDRLSSAPISSPEKGSPLNSRTSCVSKHKTKSWMKNQLTVGAVSTVANNKTAGGFEITFVNMAEKANAAQSVVASKGIPIGVTDGSTRSFNIGTGEDPRARQPVTLGQSQQSKGFLYTQGGELKLGSTIPQWDSWLICDGQDHPELFWVGVVQGVVEIPEVCSAVRLFAEDPADPMKNMGTC